MSCGCKCSYCVSCNSSSKGLTVKAEYEKDTNISVKVKKKDLYTKKQAD